MRVATYNVLHGRPWPGHHPFSPRRFAGALTRLDADVVALQELDRRTVRSWGLDQPAIAARALRATAEAFAPTRRLGPGGRYGNALYARGALSAIEVVALPRGRRREPRSAILARARLDVGGEISVAATHLQNDAGDARRQLHALIDAFAARPEPRLLLGDLNLPTSVCEPVLRAAGYTLAPAPDSSPAHAPVQRIDHVAVAGLEVTATAAPELGVGDHRPVVVELAARPPASGPR